jgi:hypothetical protein
MRTRDGHAFGKVLMMGSVSWFPSTVWQLMGKYLRRGAMADGLVEASVEGTPQGGRLSPLLANIYLDALDKEREKRGHCFCRYADDCNIYVGSQTAAERTQASIQSWIEKHLRLKVKPLRAERGRSGNASCWGFDWIARSGSESRRRDRPSRPSSWRRRPHPAAEIVPSLPPASFTMGGV